ncbi:hypothetical protein [Clostridium sp. CF012]|uniref:hypothetical protein n=1 Tax=Clostridium sp. CF012 TaxID=2843319 RepID=UPI001C0E70B6|nr:hypothetical protein [Clostridium sp. CF012]MBU3146342.1 hypothetical protein [Clostridium sp. CF012]
MDIYTIIKRKLQWDHKFPSEVVNIAASKMMINDISEGESLFLILQFSYWWVK